MYDEDFLDVPRLPPPTPTPAPAAPGETPPAQPASPGLVNLNTATADQLDDLPGIGPALAQRVIDYRTEHGPFRAVDELARVNGISSAMVDEFRDLVTVSE